MEMKYRLNSEMKYNSLQQNKILKTTRNFEMKDGIRLQRNKILKDYAEFWNESSQKWKTPKFEMKDNSLQRNKILKDYAEFWNESSQIRNERQFFATK